MHIAVVGAGGVGGYFGGFLARAENHVTLIARGVHLEAIRAGGLTLKSPQRDFNIKVDASDDPRLVGPVELVILAVKTYQNDRAIPAMEPLIGEHTSLLSLQNGVDSYKDLVSAVGPERVLPGVTYIATQIESPGVIRHQGPLAASSLESWTGNEPAAPKAFWRPSRRRGCPPISVMMW